MQAAFLIALAISAIFTLGAFIEWLLLRREQDITLHSEDPSTYGDFTEHQLRLIHNEEPLQPSNSSDSSSFYDQEKDTQP